MQAQKKKKKKRIFLWASLQKQAGIDTEVNLFRIVRKGY